MTTFNDREKGFENKFAHDAEMQFRAHARSNKMLGLWAASLLGKTGADAEAYAMEVLKADFAEIGQEDVYRKIEKDLDYRADELTIRANTADARTRSSIRASLKTNFSTTWPGKLTNSPRSNAGSGVIGLRTKLVGPVSSRARLDR